MIVEAVYENSALRPLEKLDLKEGDMAEIEVKGCCRSIRWPGQNLPKRCCRRDLRKP